MAFRRSSAWPAPPTDNLVSGPLRPAAGARQLLQPAADLGESAAGTLMLRRAWPRWRSCGDRRHTLWDPGALDDVWRWSSGQEKPATKSGAGRRQLGFVLAFGWVADRFSQWPFWSPRSLALPLLLWFVRRQQHAPALSNACWHYGVFLFAFFYASRFLNENYLGYILAFLAIGLFSSLPPGED